MELRIQELTAKVEKEAEGKRLAVADREMAMESLSRSAVHLTEYKVRCRSNSMWSSGRQSCERGAVCTHADHLVVVCCWMLCRTVPRSSR